MVFLLRSVGGRICMAACPLVLAASCVFGQAGPAPKSANSTQALLPSGFSSWMGMNSQTAGTSAAVVDAANADVLNEYGLKNFAEGMYRHGGNKLILRAMRFADATGAYGAFTFYRKEDMKPEAIGNDGAGNAHEIIFWSGVIVVDAQFDPPAENEAAALKVLVKQLPPAGGSDAVPPSLPQYLPPGLESNTVHYAVGPIAYTRMGGVLPPSLIDFSRDAEAVTAQYQHRLGNGTLTVLEYPTPQMANDRAKAINAILKGPLPPALQQSNPAALAVKHSGPLVAVTSGNFAAADAQALLDQVKYQAEVTFNRGGGKETIEVKNAAKMLIGIAYLTAILAAFAVLFGIFLGGGRALWRTMHGKPISTVYEEDFISLNLNEEQVSGRNKLP